MLGSYDILRWRKEWFAVPMTSASCVACMACTVAIIGGYRRQYF